MALEVNELKWSQFRNKLKTNHPSPEIFRTIWESENKVHAETIFLFAFNYVSKVSFNEPSCCIRFVETASLNLVSERFVPLTSFLLLLWILNIHLYSPTLLLIKIYLISARLYLIIYMKLLHYIRDQSILIFLYI